MNIVISTGTSVMDRIDAATIANVLVKASGRNIRPSCASSRKTGTNETTMIASEKKIDGATYVADRMRQSGLSSWGTVRDARVVLLDTLGETSARRRTG